MKTIHSTPMAKPIPAPRLMFANITLTAFAIAFACCVQTAWAAPAVTATTLIASAEGNPATTIAWGSVVTLTANVKSGTTTVTKGLVGFCDASAKYCTDIHLLGTAQLTGALGATISFVPPIGSHTYKAVFAGTKVDAASTSISISLNVAGPYPTAVNVEATGTTGHYELETTITGIGTSLPTGTVAYLDSSNNYALLGSAELEGGTTEPLTFVQSFSLPVTGGSLFAAAGVFNGDGLCDLAVINTSGNSVLILLGNGDGTFTPLPETPNTGAAPIAIAVADFNADGALDLAVVNNVNGGTGSITVLLGNGDGTFTSMGAGPATGVDPNSIAVADFNGDGIPDLAVLNNANGHAASVTVLIGGGNGTFKAAATSPQTNSYPTFIVTGDFNGDGFADLAVTNAADKAAGTLAIFLGKGDGTFNPTTVKTSVGYSPASVAVGDFNADGKTDLAVLNTGGTSGTGPATVTLLLGKGTGAFASTATTLAAGQLYNSIAIGDFNGDRVPDLAVSATGTAALTTILQGNGVGGFGALPAAPAIGTYPSSIAAVDLIGDGKTAIVSGEDVLLPQRNQRVRTLTDEIAPIGISAPHLVEAVYSGDTHNAGSISTTVSLNGEMLMPTVKLHASAASSVSGATLTLSSTVAGPLTVTGYDPMPTGGIMFYAGAVPLALVPLTASGAAALSTSALSVGLHTLTAVYAGDSNYRPAVSAAVTVTITPKPAAAIVLKSSVKSAAAGKPVAFTVTASGSGAKPTGAVAFYVGKTLLCSSALNASGAAACSSAKLGVGNDSITATYNGDKTYAAATSKPVVVAITKP